MLARRSHRLARRRAALLTGSHRFASIGPGSRVIPPATVIGPELIRMGSHSRIREGSFISVVQRTPDSEPGSLVIGDRVEIGSDALIACCGGIEIEDDVLTADRIFIGDTYHGYREIDRPIAQQPLSEPKPVLIRSGAFLGVGSAVLPGVTVGRGACVGANAVVTRDVPDHSVVVGNPAVVVRRWDGKRWAESR